jgi:hypothetical protein
MTSMTLYSSRMRYMMLAAAALLAGSTAFAQRDTSRPRQVTVTSAFKPTLKEAAKINFNATPPTTDTTRPRLQYQLPNQNLSFAFQPGSLRPLALSVDTGGKWDNESFIKAGFGNLKTPYLQAGLSIGDGRTAGLNLYARHVSSKGKRIYQDFSNTNLDLNAFFQTSKNMEWNARVGGAQESYNKYGFQPVTNVYPSDSLEVRFQTWRGRVGFRNINKTEFGLSYAPEIRVDVFSDRLSNTESNTYAYLPLEKSLTKAFTVNVALEASLGRYKPEDKDDVANNYFTVAPSVLFHNKNINLQAGLKPAWDNGSFKVFPNVTAEFSTSDNRFAVQLGWIGRLRNSGYQYLAGINPWIWAPESVYNTQIEERYAGLKGSAGDHFSFSAKVGYNTLRNQPLFNNDTMFGGKSFMVIHEPKMNVLHIGGEVAYTVGEKFSWINSFAMNNYNNLEVNEKAWGLLPIELRSSLRLQVLKDLYLNTELFAFDAPWVMLKNDRRNLQGSFDLSAGLEFKIVKNVKLWAQFNNIFNREYERWYQYPTYGFNFLGGVVFSFAQKN